MQYRYYIPCFTAFLICLFILIMVLFCLPETLSKEDVRKNKELLKRSRVGVENSIHSQEGMAHLKEKRERDPNYRPTEEERIQEILMRGSYVKLVSDKRILLSVVLYGLLSLVQGGQDSLYPVWMINPAENKGFGWTQSEVGLLYSWLGPVQILAGHIHLK